MNEDPELFVDCMEGGWIELRDENRVPVASIIDEHLALAHKMKAASRLYDSLKKLLAYHQWAKNPGRWDEEPEDPESECVAALAYATIPGLPTYEAF
jgi:hypothetical protein